MPIGTVYLGFCPQKGDLFSVPLGKRKFKIIAVKNDIQLELITYEGVSPNDSLRISEN